MYSGTEALNDIVARHHRVSGELVASVNGTGFDYPVVMKSAQVSVSYRSNVRRKLSAIVEGNADSPIADVFGTEIRAYYIMSTKGSADEVKVPVGTFVVTDAKEREDGTLAITGTDRWQRVQNARFLAPRVTSGYHVNVITTLLQEVDPRIAVIDETGSTSRHNSRRFDRDRDKAITDMAAAIGAKVWFDPMGDARITYQPSLDDPSVWTVNGGNGGALIKTIRTASQGTTYNAVSVSGDDLQNTDIGFYGIAFVTDPASPIRWGGPYGYRPRFYRSAMVTTQAQANATAARLLPKYSMVSKGLQFDASPHPGLEAGDVITVESPTNRLSKYIADEFTLKLEPGSFSVVTRSAPVDDDDLEG